MNRRTRTAIPVIAVLVLLFDAAGGRLSTFHPVFDAYDVNRRLLSAVESGDMARVRAALRRGADAGTPTDGATALHVAARCGRRDMMALFLTKGVPVDARAAEDATPLHVAITEGFPEVIRLLLATGADVNASKTNGDTPLHCAAIMGRADMAALLIERGADMNAKNGRGETPLSYAAWHGYERATETLIAKGADLNAGRPLHVAAEKGERWVVWILLEHGADVNATNDRGRTPLDVARDEKTRTLLRKYGAVSGSAGK